MAYKPFLVANSFIKRANDEGVKDIDQLKIQKLVYCMHGWNLAVNGEPLVGEFFEAWPYGPVLSSLYHEFKSSKKNRIEDYASDIDPSTGEERALMVAPSVSDFYELFDKVWSRYKGFSGIQLSALTHAPGTPWSLARARRDDYLSNDEIRNHFIELTK